ncbi:MAG: hypothetical protein IKY30_08980 [Oscillospiraceae bacterium]|nr:hypothetical protein [Oscillospiraceae bacterium]
MKKTKNIVALACVIIVSIAIFKIYYSIPNELEKITSPNGKITATIVENRGDIIIETNKSNPILIDSESKIEYGMSAFSDDSRYLFVAAEKTGYGNIELIDFQNNRWENVNIISIIRTSDEFKVFAADNGIEECHEQTVTVLDIYGQGIVNTSYHFNDQSGKCYTPLIWLDLVNQKVEVFK